jgi:hypothetical protein
MDDFEMSMGSPSVTTKSDEKKLEKVYKELIAEDEELASFPKDKVMAKLKQKLTAKRTKEQTPDKSTGRRTASGVNESTARQGQAELDSEFDVTDSGYDNKVELEPVVVGATQGLLGGAMPTLQALKNISPIGRLERFAHELTGSDMNSPYVPMEMANTGQGMLADLRQSYINERDRMVNLDAQMQQEPEYHMANTAGAVAPMVIPGGGAAVATRGAAAPIAGKVAAQSAKQAALLGGVTGATQGALSSEGVIQGELMSLEDMATDAAVGGVTGTILGGGLGYLGAKAGMQSRQGPLKKAGLDVRPTEKPDLPLEKVDFDPLKVVKAVLPGVKGKAELLQHAADLIANQSGGRPIKMPKNQHPIIPRQEGALAKATPDQIVNYNSGNKLDFEDPTLKLDEELELPRTVRGGKKPTSSLVPEVTEFIVDDFTGSGTGSIRVDDSDVIDQRAITASLKPEALLDDVDDSWSPRSLKTEIGRKTKQPTVDPNADTVRRPKPEIKPEQEPTGKARPSAMKPAEEKPAVPEEPIIEDPTDKNNLVADEVLKLNQFRNEFRKQLKGMGPDTMKGAFDPEEILRNAEAGKELGMTGRKLVDALGGDEVAVAKILLDDGHAESIDDLVKLLGLKGAGAMSKAEQIAGDLGYSTLPKYAEGSSKARRKAASDKAKKK